MVLYVELQVCPKVVDASSRDDYPHRVVQRFIQRLKITVRIKLLSIEAIDS